MPASQLISEKSKLLYKLMIASVLFIGTYGLAWYDALLLTRRYLDDATTSYDAGEYLTALTGYEEFNEAKQKNVYYGGYAQVVSIWQTDYAYPVPELVAEAETRINEIIDQRLSIDEVEGFVQRNIGRSNPYMGRIYLRWGELYQEIGDVQAAELIYEEVIEFFPNDIDLLRQAQQYLDQLPTEEE